MNFLALIPARYASTRFPGKPLVEIHGKIMIQHVYEKVYEVLKQVFVATDDIRIADAVHAFGGNVVMTSTEHRNGTERCAEAVDIVEKETGILVDVVINIQGDEPFLDHSHVTSLMKCFDDPETEVATLIKRIEDNQDIFNPSEAKVVKNLNDFAMYFSRSPIPFIQKVNQDEWCRHYPYFKHIGAYAYRKDVLKKLVKLPFSSLEQAESLEQNRWIENGIKIKLHETSVENFAIDTPEDLERLKNKHL